MSINYKKLNKDFESKGFFVIRRLIDNKKILSLQKILSELFLLELNKKNLILELLRVKKNYGKIQNFANY